VKRKCSNICAGTAAAITFKASNTKTGVLNFPVAATTRKVGTLQTREWNED
jgi:hypothetical protein